MIINETGVKIDKIFFIVLVCGVLQTLIFFFDRILAYLQTPQLPPSLEQCLQYLQFLQAVQLLEPVQVADASEWQLCAIKFVSSLCVLHDARPVIQIQISSIFFILQYFTLQIYR